MPQPYLRLPRGLPRLANPARFQAVFNRWPSPLLIAASLFVPAPEALAATPGISLAAFHAEISAAHGAVAACRASIAACRSQILPQDSDVLGENAIPGFHAGWQWMHDAMDEASKATPPDRIATMDAASANLDELAEETSGSTAAMPAGIALPAAHAVAARILARDEFRAGDGPSWLDRGIARLQDALTHLFLGMARVGARNSWLAPLIEWLCFGLSAAALLLFVRRSLSRAGLRLSLAGSSPAATQGSGRSAADWLRAADAAEAEGHGREAVHCLYWAAVMSLEARKAWRPNPTRTPREYLGLLQPDSGTQQALRSLTRRFEQTWYGAADPSSSDIQTARQDFAAVEASVLDRNPPGRFTGLTAAASTPAGTAG